MHGPRDYLVGLAQLHEIVSGEERRALWRQGLATLARAASNQQPAPLEGLRPEALHASLRVAFTTGLVDDVGWMSPGLAAAALFEIAAALPAGEEKRELGRRVLEALLRGDAATFALLATSLASTSRRGLGTAAVRARVGVAVRLPIGLETGVDRLALALLCRPDLERDWLVQPASGPLPMRRVTARLLERAAREAARRALEGDDIGRKALRRPTARAAWMRLLSDREPLVWRHAAAARGLMAVVETGFTEDIERQLGPHVAREEIRRAITSLAAAGAHTPRAIERCREILASDRLDKDHGLSVDMLFGLSRAATLEPEAVEAMLPELLAAGDIDTIEAFVDLMAEHPGWRRAGRALMLAIEQLRNAPHTEDDGLIALRRQLDAELSPLGAGRRASLRQHILAAQLAFVEGRELRPHVEAALDAAGSAVGLLERAGDGAAVDRQRAFQIMRELDRGVLETSLLADLMVVAGLDPAAGDLGDVIARLRAWLVARERIAPASVTEHLTLRRRRLRALVHAIDFEGFALGEEPPAIARDRRLQTLDLLLTRLSEDPESPVRRLLRAALARACEGLLRDEVCELGDLLVAAGAHLRGHEELLALAEVVSTQELRDLLTALAELARRTEAAGEGFASQSLHALSDLAEALPPGLAAPVEALRRALVGVVRALERIAAARSLASLVVGPGAGAVERVGEAVRELAELTAAVWRRLGHPERGDLAPAEAPWRALDSAVTRAARGEREGRAELVRAAAATTEAVRAELPAMIAAAVVRLIERLPNLPEEAPVRDLTPPPVSLDAALSLPAWLPPSRVLGGFYVLRPIGAGAVGSVFVVRRAEERHDEAAERFALKVPSYDGSVALTLSEEEFLRLFREEAGALLTLPAHPNLASFVTFDARARPKPILVMELVEGPTLERVIERRDLSFGLAFEVLDGIAAGLEAMHALGIGHLDLKPANIILRTRAAAANNTEAPAVLVDFGLAGRNVRPGCASPYYGAPEVWDVQGLGPKAEPAAADVYSFCCLAYELLLGRRLFAGDTLPSVVAAHFAHDGKPPGLDKMFGDARLQPVAQALSAGMVNNPPRRAPITQVRAALAAAKPALQRERWPIEA
jgi:hypothetical protein